MTVNTKETLAIGKENDDGDTIHDHKLEAIG
jgi:hypothetical protein